ncbi:hypothetical protein GCM10007049_21620 [Echinicola pacifica]|uniref:Uncharacterized protein n=1 Tax=Echinicola pacifica TaxID=346377 RepID=A0A918Q2C4_9BACT|nr:hypothetical protein GCM10007049_21620 [Echinicola pacifica]
MGEEAQLPTLKLYLINARLIGIQDRAGREVYIYILEVCHQGIPGVIDRKSLDAQSIPPADVYPLNFCVETRALTELPRQKLGG